MTEGNGSAGPIAAGTEHRVTAAEADAGGRLDVVLAGHLPGLSRSRIQSLIRGGHAREEDGPEGEAEGGRTISEPSQRVKPGQTFAIFIPEAQDAAPAGQDIPLTVIYEDAHLIVIDKPAGLVVHPAAGNPDRTLVNALIAHCGASLSGIGGVRRPGIVHRLDKDTSGLMVAAKTDAAHAGLAAQFEARSIDRAYTAIVWGALQPAVGEIAGNIGRSPRNRKKMAVVGRGGKPALTRYRTIRTYGASGGRTAASRLECRLSTGRTHQLRVHLTHTGHGIIGDPVYGRSTKGGKGDQDMVLRDAAASLGRQALHAHLIGFDHPETGERHKFTSDLPGDINALINCLESF